MADTCLKDMMETKYLLIEVTFSMENSLKLFTKLSEYKYLQIKI